MSEDRRCPVCGFAPLDEPPYPAGGGASLEICECCGFQFGYTDDDQGFTFEQWRARWIARGMPWDTSGGTVPPPAWDPEAQLNSLTNHDDRPSAECVRFCEQTAAVAPGLAPILAHHLDYHDELLSHVYFEEVSRWAIANVSSPGPSPELARLLDLLETSFQTADDDVHNVIAASFVEMVEDEPDLVRLFGPALLTQVQPRYRPT